MRVVARKTANRVTFARLLPNLANVSMYSREAHLLQHWLGRSKLRTRRAERQRARTPPQRASRLGRTWRARGTRRGGSVNAVRARGSTQTRAYNTDTTLVAEPTTLAYNTGAAAPETHGNKPSTACAPAQVRFMTGYAR